MSEEFEPSELTRERSLWSIMRQCWRLPINVFNLVVTVLAIAIALLYVLVTNRKAGPFIADIRSLAVVGLSFASTILGFLIAGFTVFATITRVELFKLMAVTPHERSGLSFLKYNFFAFVNVFAHFLTFCALCLLVIAFGSSGGAIAELVSRCGSAQEIVTKVIARCGFATMVVWMIYLVLLLKSFIFNIYHVVMTSIRWEFEKPTEINRRD